MKRLLIILTALFVGMAGLTACGNVPSPTKVKELRDSQRALWADHVTFTRLAIVEFAPTPPHPGFSATAARLLKNQDDIGASLKPFYGAAAGDTLAAMLKEHINQAVAILTAAKAGQPVTQLYAEWQANAEQIADTMNNLNPDHWKQDAVKDMLYTHLQQTLDEAGKELAGDYAGSISAYDSAMAHMLMFADVISEGILKQHPGKLS